MIRAAVFIPGGVGDPSTPMHVPAQVDLISRLSRCSELMVYSLIKPDGIDRPFTCGNAEVKFVRARYNSPKAVIAEAYLRSFLADHRRRPFDLVHGIWALPCGALAVLAGRIVRIPSVVSLQGGEAASLSEINYGNMRKLSSRKLTLWTCRRATTLTALTGFQQRSLRAFGMLRDDLHVIPYGPAEEFSDGRPQRALTPPFRFLSVGHLNAVKDHATALNAFRRISEQVDARLRIIGEDVLHGEVHRRANDLGIADRVEFTGHVPHRDLAGHYQWAHVLLHTARYEGQGAVIAEAATSGLVVCGTRVGLIADLEPDAAVAVDVGDAEALASEALHVLGHPDRYRKLQAGARRWALEHPASRTANDMHRVYEQTVNV